MLFFFAFFSSCFTHESVKNHLFSIFTHKSIMRQKIEKKFFFQQKSHLFSQAGFFIHFQLDRFFVIIKHGKGGMGLHIKSVDLIHDIITAVRQSVCNFVGAIKTVIIIVIVVLSTSEKLSVRHNDIAVLDICV